MTASLNAALRRRWRTQRDLALLPNASPLVVAVVADAAVTVVGAAGRTETVWAALLVLSYVVAAAAAAARMAASDTPVPQQRLPPPPPHAGAAAVDVAVATAVRTHSVRVADGTAAAADAAAEPRAERCTAWWRCAAAEWAPPVGDVSVERRTHTQNGHTNCEKCCCCDSCSGGGAERMLDSGAGGSRSLCDAAIRDRRRSMSVVCFVISRSL